ncbi:hypothetical protein [Rhodopila sp.]|uniref:hypothetical protein n=1 Tax=Rhodopila sp. TaxID=2480087 RepID=UPI003D0DEFEC
MKSDLIDIAGTIQHETDKAYLVDTGLEKPVWLAKSMVEHDPADGTFAMPEWLAMEKGLI